MRASGLLSARIIWSWPTINCNDLECAVACLEKLDQAVPGGNVTRASSVVRFQLC